MILFDNVIRDLEAVKHIILPTSRWGSDPSRVDRWVYSGRDLRKRLSRVKSLEKVSLINELKWDVDCAFIEYDQYSKPNLRKSEIYPRGEPFNSKMVDDVL